MKQRILSIILSLLIVIGMFPVVAPVIATKAVAAVSSEFSDSELTVFDALGIETSVPDGYVQDETVYDSPYGKTYTTMAEVNELFVATRNSSHKTSSTVFGDNNLNNVSDIYDFFSSSYTSRTAPIQYGDHPLEYADLALSVEGNFSSDNKGQKKNIAYLTAEQYYIYDISNDVIGEFPATAYLYLAFSDADGVSAESKFSPDRKELYHPSSPAVYEDVGITGTLLGNPDDAETRTATVEGSSVKYRGLKNIYIGYNYLKITAGDFDGDGIDEVAMYIGDYLYPRIDVYKLQKTSGNSYLDVNNWERAWSYCLLDGSDWYDIPNMVSLAAEDFDKDGIDDLAVTYTSRTYAEAMVMMGDDNNNMLTKSYSFSVNETTGEYLTRASFTTGDVDGDGYNELVLGGSLYNEYEGKIEPNTRYVGIFEWNGGGFSCVADDVIDLFEMDEAGNRVHEKISDRSSGVYYSLAAGTANMAVGRFYGMGTNPCIYIDSIVVQYTDDGFEVVELVDYATHSGSYFVEYGVRAVDLVGQGKDTLVINSTKVNENASFSILGLTYNLKHTNKHWIHAVELSNYENDYSYTTIYNPYGTSGSTYPIVMCTPDTDNDTTILKYTGEHYYTYSDPKVLAVLASPPYFKDLADSNPDCGMMESSTSYETSVGSSEGSSVSGGFSVGAYTSWEQSFEILGVEIASAEAETEINNSFTWETEKTTSLEFSRGYSTFAGSDAVVMFSLPVETYVYEASVPNGNGTYDRQIMTVNIPYEPSYQTIPLEKYREIQPDYKDILPEIGKEIISHEVGNPGSYPVNEAHLPGGISQVISYDGDPSKVGQDGISAQNQTISLSSEEAKSFSYEFTIDTKAGFGAGGVKVGVTAGASAGAGTVSVDSTGSTYSAEVCSLPEEARQYGYTYNWKLATFLCTSEICTFPVVTYLVTNVIDPPALPQNFRAVSDETTTDTVTLEWDYAGNAAAFILYRYYQATSDAGFYEIATITAGDENNYEVVDGVKHYKYADIGLSANNEYKYKIQTVSEAQPNLSTQSYELVTYTKPDTGVPELSIDKTQMTAYADKSVSATVSIVNKDELTGARLSYQWQKLNSQGKWVDINGLTGNVLTISYGEPTDAGEYRCKLSARVDQNLVVVYSESVSVDFARYNSKITDVTVGKMNSSGEYPVTVLFEGDSDSTPAGNYVITLSNSAVNTTFITPVKGNKTEFNIKSSNGVYFLNVNYNGSTVYKPCAYESEEPLLLQVGQAKGILYEYEEKLYYGDNIDITEWTVAEDGTVTKKTFDITADNFYCHDNPFNSSVYPLSDTRFTYYFRSNIFPRFYDEQRAGAAGSFKFKGNDGVLYSMYVEGRNYAENAIIGLKDKYTLSADMLNIDDWNEYWTAQAKSWGIKNTVPEWSDIDSLYNTQLGDIWIDVYQKNTTLLDDYEITILSSYYDRDEEEIVMFENYNPSKLSPGLYTVYLGILGGGSFYTDNLYYHLQEAYNASYTGYKVNLYITGEKYPVSVSVNDDIFGSVQKTYPEDTDSAAVGQSIIFKATPNPGYMVDYWSVNGKKVEGTEGALVYTHTQTNDGCQAEVHFTEKQNTLNVGISPEAAATAGSKITISGKNSQYFVNGNVYMPNSIKFTFGTEAVSGWTFSRWEYIEGENAPVYTDEGIYTLAMPDAPVTLNAIFEREKYSLTLGSNIKAYDSNGNEITDLSAITGDSRITVKPAPGYKLNTGSVWNVNGKNTGNNDESYTFAITANTIVSAYVIPVSCAVVINRASEGGFATATKTGSVVGGTQVIFTAEAYRGYEFDYWSISSNGGEPVEIKDNSYTMNVVFDLSVTPVFKKQAGKNVEIYCSNGNGTVSWIIDSKFVVSDTEDSSVTLYPSESISITGVAGSAQYVAGWRENGKYKSDSSEAKTYTYDDLPETVGLVCKGITTYKVNFATQGDTYGTFTAISGGKEIKSGDTIDSGSKVVFTYTPLRNECVEAWYKNSQITEEKGNVFTIDFLESDTDILLKVKENYYAIEDTTSNKNNYYVNYSLPEAVNGLYCEGSKVSITVVPNTNYAIEVVSDAKFEFRSGGSDVYVYETDYLDEDVYFEVICHERAPQPQITPHNDGYGPLVLTGNEKITISCSAANAVIYYTTDGTIPTVNSNVYTEPLTNLESCKIMAIAVVPGYAVSNYQVESYEMAEDSSRYTYAITENTYSLIKNVNTESAASIYLGDAQWYVIGDGKNGVAPKTRALTLLSRWCPYQTEYNSTQTDGEDYATSILKSKADAYYTATSGDGTPIFPQSVKESIIPRALAAQNDGISGGTVENAHFWALSVDEANKLNSSLRTINSAHTNWAMYYWWLRTPASGDGYVAYVNAGGTVNNNGAVVDTGAGLADDRKYGARFGTHFDTDGIWYISVMGDGLGKDTAASDGEIGGISGANNATSWKLTFTDNNRKFNATATSFSERTNKLSVSYTGANVGSNEYISVIIRNDFGNISHYGRMCKPEAANGTLEFTIPDCVAIGGSTIEIYSEQYNDNTVGTDYASVPVTLTIPVAIDEGVEFDDSNSVIYIPDEYGSNVKAVTTVGQNGITSITPSYTSANGNIKLYGTGTKITVTDSDGTTVTYTLVIEGDLNGDGVCDVLDASAAALYSTGKDASTDVQRYAAKGMSSSDEIDVNDYAQIVNMIV